MRVSDKCWYLGLKQWFSEIKGRHGFKTNWRDKREFGDQLNRNKERNWIYSQSPGLGNLPRMHSAYMLIISSK